MPSNQQKESAGIPILPGEGRRGLWSGAYIKPTDGSELALDDPDNRSKLAKVVMRLFDKWELSQSDRLNLLGLSPNSRQMLSRYAQGQPLPKQPDLMDRVGLLLTIHRSLRMLYPENADICYSWIKLKNELFGGITPLELMKAGGLLGIAQIARYLDQYLRI